MLSSKLAEEEIWCLPGWTGEHMLKTSWWFQYFSITSCFSIYLGWLWLVKSLPSLPGNLLIQQTADLEAFHLGRRADRKLVESQQPKRGLFGSRQFVSTGLSTSMVIDHYFGGIPPIKRQDLLVRKLHYGSRLGSESGLSLLSWDPILGLARSVLLVTTDLSSNDVQCIHRETCKFQPNGVEIVTMQRHFHERCWRYSAQGAAWPVGHQVKATVFSKPGNANPMVFSLQRWASSIGRSKSFTALAALAISPSQVHDGSSGQPQDLLPRHQEDQRGPDCVMGIAGDGGMGGWCQAPKLMDFRKGTTTLGFVSPVCVSRWPAPMIWKRDNYNWNEETWQTIASKAFIVCFGVFVEFSYCKMSLECFEHVSADSNGLYSGSRAVSSSQWIPVPPWVATLVQQLWRRRVPSGNLQTCTDGMETEKCLEVRREGLMMVNDKYWEMVIEWEFSKLD